MSVVGNSVGTDIWRQFCFRFQFASFLRAFQTYFHQGHDMFGDWEENKREKLATVVTALKQNGKRVERKMQDRHMLVPKVCDNAAPTGLD